jgi:uncharacterized protein YjbI with pentapeptide repeats
MTCWPVSARVGNVKNNDPSLITSPQNFRSVARRARLSGANLSPANLGDAKLSDADLGGATVTQAQLAQACGTDVKLGPRLTIKPCP